MKYLTYFGTVTGLLLALGLNCAAAETSKSVIASPKGTYFLKSLQQSGGSDGPPLPMNPYPELNPTSLGDGKYLVDDLELVAAKELLQLLSAESGPPSPGEGGGGGDVTNNIPPAYNYTTNDLWLEVPTNYFAVANEFTVLLHNAVAGKPYEIITKSNLSEPIWKPERWIRCNYSGTGGPTYLFGRASPV